MELVIGLGHLQAQIVQPVLTADHAEEGTDKVAHQLVEAADVSLGGHSGLGQEPGGGAVLGVVGEQILIVLQGDDDLLLDGVILTVGVHGVEAAEDVRIVAGSDGQVELLAGHHHVGLNELQGDAGELRGLLIPAGVLIAVGQGVSGSSAGPADKIGKGHGGAGNGQLHGLELLGGQGFLHGGGLDLVGSQGGLGSGFRSGFRIRSGGLCLGSGSGFRAGGGGRACRSASAAGHQAGQHTQHQQHRQNTCFHMVSPFLFLKNRQNASIICHRFFIFLSQYSR